MHSECSLSAFRAVLTPTMPEAPTMMNATRNSTPVISFTTRPPTSWPMSAIEWQLGWFALNWPWTRAHQVFRACQPSTLMAPGRAPRTNMALGMVRTPVAKMTFATS